MFQQHQTSFSLIRVDPQVQTFGWYVLLIDNKPHKTALSAERRE